MKNKVLIIFGTRPEAIKMAPVVRKMKEAGEWPGLKICVTAQHREMLDQVLEIFDIHPDYDLNVMKPNQDLYNLTSTVLLGLGKILEGYKPDLVMVHGDTTTSFCAALAAYYKQIPVAHVEAGLRTGNIYAPWPEEINRKLTGAITKYHFAPTESARLNLEKEGIKENIFVTGNTVIDALQIAVSMIHSDQALQSEIIRDITGKGYTLGDGRKIILIRGIAVKTLGKGLSIYARPSKKLPKNIPKQIWFTRFISIPMSKNLFLSCLEIRQTSI